MLLFLTLYAMQWGWYSVNEEQLECRGLNGRPQIREFITTFVAGYKLEISNI